MLVLSNGGITVVTVTLILPSSCKVVRQPTSKLAKPTIDGFAKVVGVWVAINLEGRPGVSVTSQGLYDMRLTASPEQVRHKVMSKRMPGLVLESETAEKQRKFLTQDVGRVRSADLAEKKVVKAQGILERRTDLADVPTNRPHACCVDRDRPH